MKSVRVAELKNKLSSYLDEVELGEIVLVKNRNRIVARIVPVRSNEQDEEQELVSSGKLRLPEKEMTKKFVSSLLKARMPAILKGTSVEAVIRDREESQG